jgi:uracil-DNA glycosylase
MGLTDAEFYDPSLVAIVPMGFCYPGRGKSGDLPPMPVCAPTWHHQILQHLQNIECTLLIGLNAQRHYLADAPTRLTDTVENWRNYAPSQFVIPHPSPRNQLWLRRNPWFEKSIVPALQGRVRAIMQAA